MNKFRYFFSFLLVGIISCDKIEFQKDRLISDTEKNRKENFLLSMKNDFKKDSSINIEYIDEYFDVFHPEFLRIDLNNKKYDKYSIVDYYSNSKRNVRKVLIYKSEKGKVSLEQELESCENYSDLISYNYHCLYSKREKLFFQNASKRFEFLKEKFMDSVSNYAKNNNLEICGTGLREMIKDEFGTKEEFKELKISEYLNYRKRFK